MQTVKPRQCQANLKTIEKYQFNTSNLIGRGASANVYLGRTLSTGQKVAIKVIDKLSFAAQYNLKNIQSEIDIMKKVRHPNIVQLLDVYQTQHNMYIVTEYCDEDLAKWLKRYQKAPEGQALKFLKDILRGFQYLVGREITHRDLKPANLLIKGGVCKISDFGFARNLERGEDTILRSVVGTPLYMAPQILLQTKYTAKSDLWSVGLIYYQLLHGQTPWSANTEMQLIQNIMTKPVVYGGWISEKSRKFIEGCLKIDEIDRMDWSEAFEHDLVKPLNQELKDNREKENTNSLNFNHLTLRSPSRIRCSRVDSQSHSRLKVKERNFSKTPTRSPLNQILAQQQLTPTHGKDRPNVSSRYRPNQTTENSGSTRYRQLK